MKIGIVGHEALKFTKETRGLAKNKIAEILLINHDTELMISGGCHLGGIDKWAMDIARQLKFPVQVHLPKTLNWEGYKARNILIAQDSDIVYSLVVKEYPPNYKGMRFPWCYHCKTNTHIKSGGCWTAKYAGKIGKQFEIVEI